MMYLHLVREMFRSKHKDNDESIADLIRIGFV